MLPLAACCAPSRNDRNAATSRAGKFPPLRDARADQTKRDPQREEPKILGQPTEVQNARAGRQKSHPQDSPNKILIIREKTCHIFVYCGVVVEIQIHLTAKTFDFLHPFQHRPSYDPGIILLGGAAGGVTGNRRVGLRASPPALGSCSRAMQLPPSVSQTRRFGRFGDLADLADVAPGVAKAQLKCSHSPEMGPRLLARRHPNETDLGTGSEVSSSAASAAEAAGCEIWAICSRAGFARPPFAFACGCRHLVGLLYCTFQSTEHH